MSTMSDKYEALKSATEMFIDGDIGGDILRLIVTRIEEARHEAEIEDAEGAGFDPDRFSGSRY